MKDCSIIIKRKKFVFMCGKCGNQYGSAPKNYFFYNMKLDYDVALKLMYLFTCHASIKTSELMLGIGHKTVIDWYNFCREVCFLDITRNTKKIGGQGSIVEIDESLFGKRKYNKGRFIEGQWVIGGIERDGTECFLEPIKKRDGNTLLEVILRNVKEGTHIVTDEWKGYRKLKEHNYIHSTVNHSVEFVNKETGQHTNKIEGTWAKVKKKCNL